MDWKRAVIFGGIAAGVGLALSGRRALGVTVAGVGLAVLASEHPDAFERVWQRAPEYLDRGNQIMNSVQGFMERLAEYQAGRESRGASPYVV